MQRQLLNHSVFIIAIHSLHPTDTIAIASENSQAPSSSKEWEVAQYCPHVKPPNPGAMLWSPHHNGNKSQRQKNLISQIYFIQLHMMSFAATFINKSGF